MSTMHWYIVLVLIAFTIPHCKGAGACERYSPCQNNGTCYDYSQESYICNCTGGFTGQNCSTEVDPCDRKMSCGNGGVCLSISGKSSHDKGYSGKYCNKTLACGSTFTEADGERNIITAAQNRTIIPPSHNRFDRVVCQYKINATIGHRIQINFIETNHTYWRRPARLPVYYEIREGISARGTPVRRWQGRGLKYPTSYLSNGNVINIVIKAASLFFDSWSVSLEYVIVTGCNMVFQRQEGVFSYSDDKPGQSASCTYQIRGNPGERIILGFQQMRLSDDPTCSHDKLSIYEGTNSSGPLAQVQCGSNTTDFLSKSHNLFLVFNAKPANFTRRFEIYYGMGERGCGRTYTSTSGIIIPQQLRPFSPPKNVHCVYQIIGEKGSTILLKAYNNVVDSLRDFFLVYEDKSTEPFAFPTRKYDNFYLSRSNNITIISGKLGRIVPTFLCHYMINNGCNARINTNSPSIRSGYFSSPPYSLQYPNAITCNYTIMVKSGFRVVLVLEADIDNSTFCSARNISVFEGINASGEQLYSGCKYQKIIARSNELFLQFRSSGIKKGKGFGALVQGRFKSCWSTPKQLNRYPAPLDIKSWNYPWKIPNNWGCFYELTPSYQNPIFVRFLKFSLEESKGCEKDNLKVYNTSISKKTLLYTRCGNQNSTLRIITRKLVLVFKSDWTIRSSAYRINVEECGGQLWDYSYWYTQRVKFLKTPAYPNHYPNDVHCIYEITAEYGNINLNFTSFELEASDGCKKDWLKIYEGSISNETLVQTRCGNDTRPYITNMLKVFMVFHTDMAVAKKGFVAEYKRCSYSFTESNGTFSTPFTFNDYYSNRYCTFLIRPRGAKKINLRLPYVLVDGKSYINIYNGSNKFAPLFTSLTKRGEIVQGHNTSISIDASAIFVEFYKSSSQHGRFTAFFFTSTGACERYSPCQNNGTCYDYSQESYTCNCTCGFTSQNCTTKVDPCDAKPCQNGVCLSISGKASQSFVCRCNSGFTGQNCTTKVDPCDAKPCQNGVCLKASQSFVCRCNSGFTGQNCTTKVDPCDVKPCQNGVCLNISGKASQSFVCHCDNGYSGKYCNYTRDFAVRSNKHVAIIATTVPVAILLVVFVTIVLIKCRRSRELLQRDAPKAALVNSYSLEDVPGAKDLSVL